MLTVLLIKRRAQSHTDAVCCYADRNVLCMRIRKQASLEVADAARDPPQGAARLHIDGTK